MPVTPAPDPERRRRLARASILRGRRARAPVRALAGVGPDSVLWLSGELDACVAGRLGRRLREHVATCHDAVVVVDLSGVTFIDCSGVDVLVTAHEELAEHDRLLWLRALHPSAQHLFGLLRRMDSRPLVDQALGAADHGAADLAPKESVHDRSELVALVARLRADLLAQTVLSQADGLVMGVHGCDAVQAHVLLAQIAARHGVAAEDLAECLVAGVRTGRHAPAPVARPTALELAARAAWGDQPAPADGRR